METRNFDSNSYKSYGKVVAVKEAEQITDTFKKAKIWIDTAPNSKYPNVVEFELVNDNISLLDDIAVNDFIKVIFSIRGNVYESKKDKKKMCFVSLRISNIMKYEKKNVSNKVETKQQKDDLGIDDDDLLDDSDISSEDDELGF